MSRYSDMDLMSRFEEFVETRQVMKHHGIWNSCGRVIDGLLSDDDVNAFLLRFDPNEETAWYTEEEDPACSAAPIITLNEAIQEYEDKCSAVEDWTG